MLQQCSVSMCRSCRASHVLRSLTFSFSLFLAAAKPAARTAAAGHDVVPGCAATTAGTRPESFSKRTDTSAQILRVRALQQPRPQPGQQPPAKMQRLDVPQAQPEQDLKFPKKSQHFCTVSGCSCFAAAESSAGAAAAGQDAAPGCAAAPEPAPAWSSGHICADARHSSTIYPGAREERHRHVWKDITRHTSMAAISF